MLYQQIRLMYDTSTAQHSDTIKQLKRPAQLYLCGGTKALLNWTLTEGNAPLCRPAKRFAITNTTYRASAMFTEHAIRFVTLPAVILSLHDCVSFTRDTMSKVGAKTDYSSRHTTRTDSCVPHRTVAAAVSNICFLKRLNELFYFMWD